MLASKKDGLLQVCAGASLLDNSRLVEWDTECNAFRPILRDTFEYYWRRDIDRAFGRLICWINFSAGAEFLAKGVCLVNGIDFREARSAPKYPNGDMYKWAHSFRNNWRSDGTVEVTYFGTLGTLTFEDQKAGKMSPLSQLCMTSNATKAQTDLILAAYQLLQRGIRNRDAHAYVPNVRDSHHFLIPNLFSEAFNILVAWLPNGKNTLTEWRADAPSIIQSMS